MAHCFEIKALPLIKLSASLLKDIKGRAEHRRWDEVFTAFDIKERSERRQWDEVFTAFDIKRCRFLLSVSLM